MNEAAQPLSARQASWTRHWHSGALHSLDSSVGAELAGALGDFWREAFATLALHDQVLDLASGNGSLPLLLMRQRGDQAPGCDAVDLAHIAPPWLADAPARWRERLNFLGGVRAEALPFEAARFQMVVSQFGLEYTDLSQSVPELLRVLAPAAAVRLVLHHPQSRLAEVAAEEVQHLDWLLQRQGLVDTACALTGPLDQARTPQGRAALSQDAGANALRHRYNTLQDEMGHRLTQARHPDALHEARDRVARAVLLATQHGAQPALQALQVWREHLADHRLRLGELLLHALNEDAVQRLCEALCALGGTARHTLLREQDHLLGWTVSLDRSALR